MNWRERVLKTLIPLRSTCYHCTMCHLGRKWLGSSIHPQVFSTMNPSRWVIVGQNPGLNERIQKVPFVGDAGKYFDQTIEKFGIKRSDFYITNCTKCWTENNQAPDRTEQEACLPFLSMELKLLKPKLVVALGAIAFSVLCPSERLTPSLGKIINSKRFDVKVFPVYHPSPRNMSNPDRKTQFIKDIKKLCRLMAIAREKEI